MNIMLDLETMGIQNNAAIVSIGACSFTREGVKETFYINVDLESSVQYLSTISASTVMWWLKQSDEARRALIEPTPVSLPTALEAFTQWCNKVGEAEYWCRGKDFDFPILVSSYYRLGRNSPFLTSKLNCYRQARKENNWVEDGIKITVHNALSDCINQTNHLLKIWRSLCN
jgi:exodeoxyribonuclease VIII